MRENLDKKILANPLQFGKKFLFNILDLKIAIYSYIQACSYKQKSLSGHTYHFQIDGGNPETKSNMKGLISLNECYLCCT